MADGARRFRRGSLTQEKECRDVATAGRVLQGEDREAMEADMMEEDVARALRDLLSRTAPGSNELPIDLYKRLTSIIAGPLLEMFQEACERGCLPADQRTTSIVVIHKEGKPLKAFSSYRPISLLNMKAKVGVGCPGRW
ncbi:hypothetical protein NDU88_003350 [Pleurodeles waltl]|uniref:Uncharacterized protein n=1 Tax=Pleurodeles waltl TaxID=8319 RepID=A0AAV7M541_PLEWA|nr:hypothetical protein NDU88_003350 [Pleurodeles waltl]